MNRLWLLLLLAGVSYGRHDIYNGHALYRAKADTEQQLNVLKEMSTYFPGADFWSLPRLLGQDILVSVTPEYQQEFQNVLSFIGISPEIVNNNLKDLFLEEDKTLFEAYSKNEFRSENEITYETYPRHDQINNYLEGLAKAYPTKVRVESGKSYEGRDIKYLLVSSSEFKDPNRPIVYVDAGIHAREWIAPITAVYILDKLLRNVTEADVVNKVDWIVMPVVNADGYEYTFTQQRMWRKTRSVIKSGSCRGVDGNRNFDFKWMFSGSSSSACSDTYAGPQPSSEPEIKLISKIFKTYADRIKLMLTFHSYGSMILYPWGFDASDTPNAKELLRIGKLAASAIDGAAPRGSSKYTVGNSAQVLYEASGGTDDYAMSVGIPFAYTVELPGRNTGFVLPPTHIKQVVHETWQGVVVFTREITKLYS